MEEGGTEPSEGFEALAHPMRMGVLQALFEANRESAEGGELSFSELRQKVDAADSGNFSYHLDRLTGLYVTSTEGGYRLTSRGFEVGLALLTQTYSDDNRPDSVKDFGQCLFCESAIHLTFERGSSVLRCGNGHQMHLARLPSEAIESRTKAELREVVASEMHAMIGRALQGICSACRCPLDGELAHDAELDGYVFEAQCDACGVSYGVPSGMCVLKDPEVVNFLRQRDADPRTTPPWEFEFCRPGRETVVSTDPVELRIEVERSGDSLSVVIDDTGTVVQTIKHR